ncbi:FAD-dependent oxidoreductase [Actinobacteria bacterium YIM 96077]|uniref:Pyridine nucleotide-disulfide oxidoreductase n=1 Tax=Phytoactinopolyspora halophila TaxID=1981511 RepID=A0A329QAG7_9ACTN|nr:FAD-dependent oxidoreductase [Phytoactinopolyspora halophila]AYY13961.1 FAD-dependent oxidoreductase [Actinobacteria bacterium YIM 96077]RAW09400.1 pyridine nucleotide-disulfide oxidoreductase [Phytoactinopolyspora halophila]
MRDESVQTDLTVVGGGLAGVCAAIAAARLGRSVALVNNRPVLGGNSSSEVRVWVCGATAHGRQRYARETGIMGELYVENQYRNPEGNPYYWDTVVHEAVREEPGIQTFLNTDVHEVEASDDGSRRRVDAITGWMLGSERRIRFESPMFADCTGDGLIGHLAGARHRIGRESRAEYDEPWAPDVADDITLGSTLLFYTKDVGYPVKYVPPSFAVDVTKTPIPERRIIRSGDNGCAYWWIEWGGEIDTVHENERIRDELWAVIYGIWDYIKNSGNFDSDTMELEWVGTVPGKREYRRFVGDYTLTQHDILAQTPFEDRVAFGGWSIDLHPPQGVYATEAGSKHWHPNGTYHIPLRCLYSANVENLWFAGRDISASHVAFGTTRVMATCAVVGQAVGSGAAVAQNLGVTPRELARDHLSELHQAMLREDASILGVRNEDPADVARAATVTASSTLTRLAVRPEPTGGRRWPLTGDVGTIVPVDPELTEVGLLVEAAADTELEVELFDTGREQNYVPHERVGGAVAPIAAGPTRWVWLDLPWRPETPRNAFVVVRENPQLTIFTSGIAEPGVRSYFYRPAPPNADFDQPLLEWPKLRDWQTFCVAVRPDTAAYEPDKAVGGYARPWAGPQLWASEPLSGDGGEWLRLDWEQPIPVRQVEIIFDDDVDEYLINLHHWRTPFEVLPTLVREYRIEVDADGTGDWRVVLSERANRWRRRVHRLDIPTSARALRLVAEATNGAPRAHVISLRVYS